MVLANALRTNIFNMIILFVVDAPYARRTRRSEVRRFAGVGAARDRTVRFTSWHEPSGGARSRKWPWTCYRPCVRASTAPATLLNRRAMQRLVQRRLSVPRWARRIGSIASRSFSPVDETGAAAARAATRGFEVAWAHRFI
jgi:hypothetical protein